MSLGIRFQIFLKKYLSEKNYEKKNVIGKGSYGTIYKVVHKTTKKVYAAKIIPSIHCFLKELFLNVYLNGKHRCIPHLREYFVEFNHDQNFCCLIYEFFPHDLFEYIRLYKTCLRHKKIVLIMREILECVEFFHKNNLIFTDISPANILIRDPAIEDDDLVPEIKFIDYGTIYLNNFLHENKKEFMNFFRVTFPYRPPELYFEQPVRGTGGGNMTHSFASDVWATACSLGEFFTLKSDYVFHGEDDKSVLEKIMEVFGIGNSVGSDEDIVAFLKKSYLKQAKKRPRIGPERIVQCKILPLISGRPEMLQFFDRIFTLDVSKRPTVGELLSDKIFADLPKKRKQEEEEVGMLDEEFYTMFVKVYRTMKSMRLFEFFKTVKTAVVEYRGAVFRKMSMLDKLLKTFGGEETTPPGVDGGDGQCRKMEMRKKLEGIYQDGMKSVEVLVEKEQEDEDEMRFVESMCEVQVPETIQEIHEYFLKSVDKDNVE